MTDEELRARIMAAVSDPAIAGLIARVRLAPPAPADPTYAKAVIDADPVWALAFWMSEVDNDDAPIGWSRYLPLADAVLRRFTLVERARSSDG